MNPASPIQVASFPIGHHLAMRQVVLAVPPQLPQPRKDDAGTGTHGGSYNGVLMGPGLCA